MCFFLYFVAVMNIVFSPLKKLYNKEGATIIDYILAISRYYSGHYYNLPEIVPCKMYILMQLSLILSISIKL